MKPFTYASLSALSLFLLTACGTGKKLEQTTASLNQLQQDFAKQTELVSSLNGKIDQLKKENETYATEMQECREVKEAVQNNLAELNKALGEKGTSLRAMFKQMEESMAKFGDAGVDLEYKNGLIFVHLQDDLMFTSGSSNIGWEGSQALKLVAEVMKENPTVTAYVVGNTDNKPVKSGYKDNWSLSTERANAITRVLVNDYKVDPLTVTPCGRSFYYPLADNATPEGRSKNRRTDIILNPNLDRIWEKVK